MKNTLILTALLLAPMGALHAADAPKQTPASPVMLSGAWLPENPHQLDFASLPKVPSEHAVVSDVRDLRSTETVAKPNSQPPLLKYGGYNLHNYLAHHDGQFWAMWSDGPGIEDQVGQRVKYATSPDGLQWSTPKCMTPILPGSGPDSPHYGTRTNKGMRWISRGFWKRGGELLALASQDEAADFFGPSLELRAFCFDKASGEWRDAGLVFKNTINNFRTPDIPPSFLGFSWGGAVTEFRKK